MNEILQHKLRLIQHIGNSFSDSDNLQKAKEMPIGTRKQRGSNWMIKTADGMTSSETIEMMRDIVQVMNFQDNKGNEINVSSGDREAAIEFLAEIHDKVNPGDLNARTLGQIAMIKKKVSQTGGHDWKQVALALLT